jgi:hypothetical protein
VQDQQARGPEVLGRAQVVGGTIFELIDGGTRQTSELGQPVLRQAQSFAALVQVLADVTQIHALMMANGDTLCQAYSTYVAPNFTNGPSAQRVATVTDFACERTSSKPLR